MNGCFHCVHYIVNGVKQGFCSKKRKYVGCFDICDFYKENNEEAKKLPTNILEVLNDQLEKLKDKSDELPGS